MKTTFLSASIILLLSLVLVGCGISQTDYDTAVAERDAAIAAKESTEAQVESLQSQISSLESELAITKLMIDVLEAVIDKETTQQPPALATTSPKGFSKYGFGFNYPENFNITEIGMLSTEANNESGIVQVTSISGMDIFQVGWFNVTPSFYELMGDSQQLLDDSFDGLSIPGIGSINKGDLLETTIAGHTMVYQGFTAEILGMRIGGVVSIHYCDVEERIYQLMILSESASTTQEAVEYFQSYLSSFVGH
jgi:hypothetical protein